MKKRNRQTLLLLMLSILLFFVNRGKRQRLLQMEKTLPETREKVLQLERIWQRGSGIRRPKSACGPTSAAMIVRYFVENGRLRYPLTENDDELVNQLYRSVGTLPIGTIIFVLQAQLYRLLNKYSVSGKWRVKFAYANNRYAQYVHAINHDNPVIIHFIANFSKKVFASHHFVVGVGYRKIGEKKFIGVLDPDAGKHNRKIHWFDWDTNEKLMNLLIISHEMGE